MASTRPKLAYDRARVAESLGVEALAMAKWAHAAGLNGIGQLLETVALAAGTAAATLQWPADATSSAAARARILTPRSRALRSRTVPAQDRRQ